MKHGELNVRTNLSISYQKGLQECVQKLIKTGGVTARDVSEQCGFKLNQNLRKALRKMVDAQLLQTVEAYTDKGHLATYYIAPIPQDVQMQNQLPF